MGGGRVGGGIYGAVLAAWAALWTWIAAFWRRGCYIRLFLGCLVVDQKDTECVRFVVSVRRVSVLRQAPASTFKQRVARGTPDPPS